VVSVDSTASHTTALHRITPLQTLRAECLTFERHLCVSQECNATRDNGGCRTDSGHGGCTTVGVQVACDDRAAQLHEPTSVLWNAVVRRNDAA
jgi:hypothetical protein